jgi:hypothetical protein
MIKGYKPLDWERDIDYMLNCETISCTRNDYKCLGSEMQIGYAFKRETVDSSGWQL